MANFMFGNKSIYYEEYGQGEPLILLNGIMMSCMSWAEFIEPFSVHNRLILVDFLDQGRSREWMIVQNILRQFRWKLFIH